MEALIYLVAIAIGSLLVYSMMAPAPKTKPYTLDDFDIPTADAGRPIPVVFGTVRITGPNVVWYGDLLVETETQDGIKTRKYYMGLHFALCHGPVDALTSILVGDRVAYTGELTTSQTITIAEDDLFGGQEKEGGIAGDFDVMMGESTQAANTYLTAAIGTPQPAWRGVLTCVFNQGYVTANTQYLKPWAFQVKRIIEGWDGGTAWYPETAPVGSFSRLADSVVFVPVNDAVYSPESPLAGDDTLITTSYGRMGMPLITGTTYYAEYGVYASEALAAISGETWLEFAGIEGLITNADFQTFANDPDMSSAAYLDQFFPTRIGLIELDFEWDGFQGTPTGGQMPHLLSCGRDALSGVSTDISWYLMIVDPGTEKLEFGFYDSGGTLHYVQSSNDSITTGTVYHVRIVLDAAEVKLYINGVLDGTLVDSAIPRTFTTPSEPAFIFAGSLIRYVLPANETIFNGRMKNIMVGPGLVDSGEDMNPAHIIYEAITNPVWGMGLSTAMIDDASFRYAAQLFWAEGMGLSMQWVAQSSVRDFMQEVLDHAGAILTVDPRSGKFLLIPIRGDYAVADLTTYDETEIVELETFERLAYGEIVSEVSVVYRDKANNRDGMATVQNLAAIQSQQGVVSQTLQFPGFSYYDLASRVAMRELKARSIPLARGKMKVNRVGWDLFPGGVFLLSWTKLGLSSVVCRVMGIDTGTLTDGVITVEFVEDVYGLPSSTYAANQVTGWTDPTLNDELTVFVRDTEASVKRQTEAGQLRSSE